MYETLGLKMVGFKFYMVLIIPMKSRRSKSEGQNLTPPSGQNKFGQNPFFRFSVIHLAPN